MQTNAGQVAGSPAAYPHNQPQQHGAFQQHGFVVGAAGQQQPSNFISPPRRDYSRPMIALNSIQIVNTVLNVSFGIAEIFIGSILAFVGVPIWAPLCFYLPAGILGVLCGKIPSQRKCLAVGCMIMSIIAAMNAVSVLIVEGFQAGLAEQSFHYCDYYNGNSLYCTKGMVAARRAVSILSALVALLELVVSIVASVYCCMVIGSTGTQTQPMTMVYTTTTATPMGAYNISPAPQFAAPQNQYDPYPGVMPAAGGAAGGETTVQLPPPSYNQAPDPLPTKN